jgi:hypothetical protein
VREHAAGQRDRPIVPDVVHADAHQVHLAHQLAPDAELEMWDRANVLDVHLDAEPARGANHLVPAAQRRDERFSDRPGVAPITTTFMTPPGDASS